ncbi:UDP-glucose dehydrogenase family protein [Granulicella arctica]|uniref:UDP-glucose dehydrogenase family protein n=1 Tax=Granulicella arctica TaxID=940613 RepID=UPI0021DFADDB|nr:UDP-glucose/GDP-mannose dehydrogenase family protein [Granulicella arctica]
MKISVVGAGYVGLVSAACFAEIGHDVICVDNDSDKIRRLSAGEIPIHEEHLPLLLERHLGQRLNFSSDLGEAVRFCEAIFICVGTPPSPNGEADLSYVEGVAREIAHLLNGPKVIVEKSTVPVGTCEAVSRTLLLSGVSPMDFSVASNPEFLREGTAVSDFLFPDRILLGVPDQRSHSIMTQIYAPILNGSYYLSPDAIKGSTCTSTKLIISSVKSAELIKHASNAFLALKISFINAVSIVCERVGADVRQVSEGLGADSRIGPRFLNPGIGYGGSCFPKDVLAFRSVARSVGYDFNLLTEVIAINETQKSLFIAKIRNALWTLRGKKLAVLGMAFKGGTDDVRDSPALDIILSLRAQGAEVRAFDPAAMKRAAALLPEGTATFTPDAYSACTGADALIVLTEWPEFANLDFARVRKLLRFPIVLDGRNLLNAQAVRDAGLTYFGIGGDIEQPLSPLNQFEDIFDPVHVLYEQAPPQVVNTETQLA